MSSTIPGYLLSFTLLLLVIFYCSLYAMRRAINSLLLLVLVVVLLEAVLLHAAVVEGNEGAHLTFLKNQEKSPQSEIVDCPSRQTPALVCWLFYF
jgi:hypothetical protein